MRVLIHAPAARMGGARTHLLGMLPSLAALNTDDRFLLVAQPDLLEALGGPWRGWQWRAESGHRRGALGRLAWEQVALPRLAAAWRADVVLSFGSFVPLAAPCPSVLEVANALPFTREHWLRLRGEPGRVQAAEVARWLLLRLSMGRAARLITPSRAMRQDVVASLPDLADRVDVAPLGVDDRFRGARWTPPASPLLAALPRHAASKEVDVLVAALALLVPRWPDLRLVLSGRPDESRWSRRVANHARLAGVERHITWAGDLSLDGVAETLATCSLAVFPTWCESFGLPLLESLAVGAPSVAGDIPACREVGGDAARYYWPGRPEALAEQIGRVLTAPEEAARLSERGRRRAGGFSWRTTAERTLESVRRAGGEASA